MGQKTCDKCGENVDEAKAFCPACGNAFVEEEQRKTTSAFEQMDNTVQMGQTMYGKMLSEMGLNISKAPDKTEDAPQAGKRVEVIAPIAAGAPAAHAAPPNPIQAEPHAKKSYLVWIIAGAAALILLLAVAVIVVAVVFLYLNR